MCSVTILAQARGGLSQFGVFFPPQSHPNLPAAATPLGVLWRLGGLGLLGLGVGGTSPNHRKLEELLCASPVGHTVAPHAE